MFLAPCCLKELVRIGLEQHESARSTDPDMLDFLRLCRVKQPSRELLTRFFADRILSKDPCKAATAAKTFQAQHEGMRFTFFMLQLDNPDATNQILRGEGLPSDPSAAAGPVVFQHGRRVRMTHNVDKDRGFVNGNGGVVEHVLRKDVLVVQTFQDVRILVHPITVNKVKFMPVSYAHATTIRRAQGATLDAVGLYFDKTRPDRGYGYVGASRAKRRTAVHLVGKVRRTDWLPVGGDREGGEQEHLSVMSESSSSRDQPDEDDMCFCVWDEDSSEPDDDGMGGGFGVAGDDEDDDDDDAMSDDDPELYRARAWDIDPDEFNASERSGLFD